MATVHHAPNQRTDKKKKKPPPQPDKPHNNRPPMDAEGEGLRVILRRARQHTARELLRNPFVFQCPPLDEFSWQQDFSWAEYETIRRGTFSRPQAQGLRAVDFETLMIDWDATWTLVKQTPRWNPNPLVMVQELRRIMNSGTPFWLIVKQPNLWGRSDLEMLATLRSLSVTEKSGELDARYISVSFMEWREAEVKRKRFGPKFPLQHKIEKGDTLKSLSKHYYHQYNGWRAIKKSNKGKLEDKGVGPSDDLWEVKNHGHRLVSIEIPKKPNWMDDKKGDDDVFHGGAPGGNRND